MLTVMVTINGRVVAIRHANNTGKKRNGLTKYWTTLGTIWHKREDGAIALARKLLAQKQEELK